MAVFSGGGGMMIEYDKRDLRDYQHREPEPPKPSIDEQVRIARERWPIPPMPATPTVENIIRAACKHFGVDRVEFFKARRKQQIVYRRHVAMYVAYQLTTNSLPEIGRRFGGFDHTTVLHAERRIQKCVDAGDQRVIDDIAAIKAIATGEAE